MHTALELSGIRFAYRRGRLVLDIDQFALSRGERLFLFGPSGSGKTTLLGVLTGVLAPQTGSVRVLGTDLAALSSRQRDAFRGAHLGYIFQLFNLIPYLSVVENITLPCRLSAARRERVDGPLDIAARDLAERLGLGPAVNEPVDRLSVGQQQRVAAARALLGAPELVVADEPTSALDHDHRERFLELLFANCARVQATLLFVSHDRTLLPLFDRAVSLPEINRAWSSSPSPGNP